MRTIFLLRGAPASGKSTWVETNNLEPYTLSPDKIRLMAQSPVLTLNGKFVISQQNDKFVWQSVFILLEQRMQRGEFIIVDATHYKSTLLGRYKDLIEQYRYRAYVVDFTDISKEELLLRNSKRTEYKQVPEETISKMCALFEEDTEVSKRFKILTPEKAINKIKASLLYDFNKYKKVVVIGDIHGCFEPLKNYFEKNPMKDDIGYIFVGDYIDRGIQNKEVIDFFISIKDKLNVCMLEGNHEKWLYLYASKNYKEEDIKSDEFLKKTIPQIHDIDKAQLRQLTRKFAQMAYFEFHGKKYFVCHGGIPIIPSIFVSTIELVKGVGKYENTEEIYESWLKNTDDAHILIHGHRNIFTIPTKVNERIYNICSEIEYGKPLRILEINPDNVEVVEMENTVYDNSIKKESYKVYSLNTLTDNEIINTMNKNKRIIKKVLPSNIISYNFSRDVFRNGNWDSLTTLARGLFVNAKTNKIIARGYNKFFAW